MAHGARAKWVRDRTDRKLTPTVAKPLRVAESVTDLHAALAKVVDAAATPDLVPRGAMILQPSDERRRSGSHYTPRELTAPIVERALEPILAQLGNGGVPMAAELLDLKICDPAMGSGAFLVETCRFLAERLVEAWKVHGDRPEVPSGEDELVFARRVVAQRCLYGVDRNPMAVDLAKMSLWLATLAKDEPLTFVDHALRDGDSLVGLTKRQIAAFTWKTGALPPQLELNTRVVDAVERVVKLRREIQEAGLEVAQWELEDKLEKADEAMRDVRSFGDLAVEAYFPGEKPKGREAVRQQYLQDLQDRADLQHRKRLARKRTSVPAFAPFHWEIEFPEVFGHGNPGFDTVVGNPPFAGKNTVAAANVPGYPLWLKQLHRQSHGNADLVAHFFRRAFSLLRLGGTFGLIATNTIGQGDTRSSGLRWICQHGGEIYLARTRFKWPGTAAVVVSIVQVLKGRFHGRKWLDGKPVDQITAFLFHAGGNDDPAKLEANANQSFQGSIVLGMGFTFDDTDTKGVATSLGEMQRLTRESPRNADLIFPYIGGQEVNTDPTHEHHRYVINFLVCPLRRSDLGKTWCEADVKQRNEWRSSAIVPTDYPGPVAADWPDLLAIVENRVRPERVRLTRNPIGRKRAKFWWQYGSLAKQLYAAIAGQDRVLAVSRVGQQCAMTFLPSQMVFADSLIIFPLDTHSAFCALQSRPHEIWARFFGSSMKDDLRYTPSDVFETFPFPRNWATDPTLEAAGQAYYDFRADLMVRNNEGLTKTYNRFHDPEARDPDIVQLRTLHTAMDRAVLDAYGWTDIPMECDFLPEHETDDDDGTSRRKKRYRYRWPDPVRDEALGRLMELNAERAEEERNS